MSFTFWALATTMSLLAVSFILIPLHVKKLARSRATMVACTLLPVSAVGVYSIVGSPDLVAEERVQRSHQRSVSNSAPRQQGGAQLGSVSSLTQGLEDRLAREPDDAGGWLLLAQSYDHLGQSADAIAAYEKAKSLGRTDANLERSLLGSTYVDEVEAAANGPALRGRVVLGPEATELVEPSDTVFIFAKESPDHRMPVVALRKPASELPIEFVLTDEHAMVAGTRLADFETLVVTAKISRSGLATDVVDGLETWSTPASPIGNKEIELVINAGGNDE